MVSIIMPCYNVEDYLQQSLESVIGQSYEDWELILVNDGSTDATSAICTYYAGRDSRIHYISQPNRGVAAARNEGLCSASGNYLAFIDADDVWPHYYLDYLMRLLSEYEADMAAGAIQNFTADEELHAYLDRYPADYVPEVTEVNLLDGRQATECSLYQQGVNPSLWGKIYRRSLFDGIEFVNGEIYEDLNIFHEITLRTRRYVRGGATVYYYRSNPESLLHVFNEGRLVVLEVTRRIEEYMRASHPEFLPAAIDRRFAANMNMLGLMLSHRGKVDITDIDRRIEECRKYIGENARGVLRNRKSRFKNRAGALLNITLPQFLFDSILIQKYKE